MTFSLWRIGAIGAPRLPRGISAWLPAAAPRHVLGRSTRHPAATRLRGNPIFVFFRCSQATPRLSRETSWGATGGLQGLKGRSRGRGRLNSRSRKRRRSRPCSASYVPESLRSTADTIWRKCVVFAKTRFAGPGPNSSSQRRSRGAKSRFGPLGGRPCPLQKAAYAGGDPEAAGSSGKSRA